ncbi:VOC family protein [Acutalibacter caecimuris]|uniref:VOC family protein n=1 Tax=Acutalibacter caecimuris TaxID=3093657 RepID=UPI002AC91E48|nr:VOC family protein [Acutalibacter sp. M00118]
MFMQHVTIYTAHLNASIAFYQDIAHLEIVSDRRPNAPMVFLANQKGETEIELIEVPAEQAYTGSGLAIGFYTDNVEEEHTRLTGLDLEPTDIISPAPGVQFFFVKDPSGVQIQLIQG